MGRHSLLAGKRPIEVLTGLGHTCQIISLESNLNAKQGNISGLILDFTDSTLDRFEVGSNMLVSSRLNCNEGESIEYVSETLIQSAWPI